MRVYGASDYAVTADGGDYTVHVVIGMDHAGRLHLLDLWRAQADASVWIEAFCDLVAKWRPLAWAEETGQIRAGVGPFLERRMRERQTFTSRRQFPTRGDKAIRAQSIIGRMALDGLRMRPDAPWIADLEPELLSFPSGKHDDQVDALGLVGQLLDVMATGAQPRGAQPRPDPWMQPKASGASWKII
jgi:predicted phage terminase large subunit-like protein